MSAESIPPDVRLQHMTSLCEAAIAEDNMNSGFETEWSPEGVEICNMLGQRFERTYQLPHLNAAPYQVPTCPELLGNIILEPAKLVVPEHASGKEPCRVNINMPVRLPYISVTLEKTTYEDEEPYRGPHISFVLSTHILPKDWLRSVGLTEKFYYSITPLKTVNISDLNKPYLMN